MSPGQMAERIKELESLVDDYKTGRRYTGGPGGHAMTNLVARNTDSIAKALRITDAEWRRGWVASDEIERLRRGERA